MLSGTRAPWPYTMPLSPGQPTRPNLPTPEGAALGREVARLAEVEEQTHPELPKRCADCAFRLGTPPNQCAGTLMDALKCAIEGETFYCHLGVPEGGEPKRVCGGYVLFRGSAKAGEIAAEMGEPAPAEPCCASALVPRNDSCRTFEPGMNGRCAYCDHAERCHQEEP